MTSRLALRGDQRAPRISTSILLLSGSLALTASCEEPAPPHPAPVVWEGQRIEIATHNERLACGGSFQYLDDFVEVLQQDQGLEWGGVPIRYYLLTSEELENLDFCPLGAQCIYEHQVYTDEPVDLHEMVHAIRAESLEHPLPGITFFEEGLAVLYQKAPRTVDRELDVYAGLESISDLNAYMPGEHYGVAGHFTRMLVDRYGLQTHIEFLDAQASTRTIADVESTFEAQIGEDFSAVVDKYRAEYPRCSNLARTRHQLECTRPPAAFDESGFRMEYNLSCEDPETLGPLQGRMWRSFTIDVVEAGRYEFTNVIHPFDFKLEVVDCDRGCLTDIDLSVESPGSIFTGRDLQPGRYLVRLSREVDSPGRAGVDIFRFR